MKTGADLSSSPPSSFWTITLTAFLLCGINTVTLAASLNSRAIVCANWYSAGCEIVLNTSPPTSSIDRTYSLNGGTVVAYAEGSAEFGVLSSSTSATITNYQPGSYSPGPAPDPSNFGRVTNGLASFREQYTVFDPSAAFLQFTLSVTGAIDASTLPAPGEARTFAWLEVFYFDPFSVGPGILDGDLIGGPDPDVTWGTNGPHTEIWTVPVTSGEPMDMGIVFGTQISLSDGLLVNPYDFTATVDFSQTATLTEILITDSSGVPIPGATLITASGTDYSLSPLNAIPLPPAVWLFGSGLLGLVGISRRKKAA